MKLGKQLLPNADEIASTSVQYLYDLCYFSLQDKTSALQAFKAILKSTSKKKELNLFQNYKSAWVLQNAIHHISHIDGNKHRTSESPHLLDELSQEHQPALEDLRFKHYFLRLAVEDRILLILWDRLKISQPLVSSAFGKTTESLSVQRDQAIRRLYEQVYGEIKKASAQENPSLMIPALLSRDAIHHSPQNEPAESTSSPALASRLAKWKRTPWYIRTGIEGFGVAITVLMTIVAIPRLRSIYESRIDRRLESYDLSSALNNKNPLPQADSENPESDSTDSENETDSNDNHSQEIVSSGPIKIQEGEIWRFYIKTESPMEMRPKIIQLLQSTDVASGNPAFRGIDAPGGIQFDLLVPKESVLQFREEIDRLAQEFLKDTGNLNLSLNQIFTWYRSRSKKPIPAGKTRIIIWLSQI